MRNNKLIKCLGRTLRVAVLARVALLGWAMLIVAPIAAQGHQLFHNLFILSSPFSLMLVSFLAVLASWQCGWVYAIVRDHSSERMRDVVANQSKPLYPMRAIICTVLAVPMHWTILRNYDGDDAAWSIAGVAVVFLIAILLTNRITTLPGQLNVWSFSEKTSRFIRNLPEDLTAGYFQLDENGRHRFTNAHFTALLGLVVLVSVYGFVGVGYRPRTGVVDMAPSLVYILLLFMMLVSLIGGVAFFLDRFRVPVVAVMLLWTMVNLGFGGPRLVPVYPVQNPAALPPAEASLLQFPTPDDSAFADTLVVVCASGGGIRAAVWTTQVLTWLQEDLGPEWTPSIRFYSGVSGGSVGLMYFLNGINSFDGSVPPGVLAQIRDVARRPSLPWLAWGMCYPDMVRVLFPGGPIIVNEFRDRGWALEHIWRQEAPKYNGVCRVTAKWSEWVGAVETRGFPAVAFGSLDIQTGRRVVFSTVAIPFEPNAFTVQDLGGDPDLFDIDIDVVTAARVSATFPYVTPIAKLAMTQPPDPSKVLPIRRAVCGPPVADIAFADGGYFDNSGLMTAVEWLRAVLPTPEASRYKRVIVIELRAFPLAPASPPASQSPLRLPEAWRHSVFGPFMGLMNTRTESQVSRGALELGLLQQVYPMIEHIEFAPSVDGSLSWQLSADEASCLELQRYGQYQVDLARLRRALGINP